MKTPFGWYLQALLLTVSAVVCMPHSYGEGTSNRKIQVSSATLLQPIDEIKLRDTLKKNKGNVVVINFWATWCEPCREEFPQLVRLYENYRHKGMRLIFLSIERQDQRREVISFLKENKVNFVTYIRSEEDFEPLVNGIDPDWIGTLPATFVINRQGKKVQSMIGGHSYADFERVIKPLL
jgi:thiol-disulfide isomerase/thioredoxin